MKTSKPMVIENKDVMVYGVLMPLNNNSVILVEKIGIPIASHRQTLSYNVASSTSRHERNLNSQL